MSGESSPAALGVYGTKGTAALNNIPGARYHSISWSDSSGNLWLFGGTGYTATSYGNLNDLWKYDIANNTWTWMSGESSPDALGVYGTKGTAALNNIPGARIVFHGVIVQVISGYLVGMAILLLVLVV
jgi:N-acetylneuraminic acid mutarotase